MQERTRAKSLKYRIFFSHFDTSRLARISPHTQQERTMTINSKRPSSAQQPEFPAPERSQALRQLELLGYKPEDKIYLRFFYPSDDQRKGSDKGRKADRLNWKEISAYQRAGRGVYFVINGGGHKDSDVTVGRAIFCEHDHLPKEIQRDLWKTLNLPSPTFQVDTGGKSIHSYWVFVEPIPIADWCELQRDLLEYVDGDRSIKNPSRVMRLAGCWHITINQGEPITNPTRIISESDCTYTYSQLRSLIPSSVNSQQLTVNSEKKLMTDDCSLITDKSVPLYQFLTKDDRALIDAGAANGTRNSSGAKLARNLIGTSSRLDYLGIRFSDDPYQLFIDYCHRCPNGDGWNQREWEAIWKSAQLDNPTATLSDEALINCAQAWLKKSLNSYQLPVTSDQKITDVRTNGRKPPLIAGNCSLSTEEISALVDELINLELPPSLLTAKLNKIAQIAHMSVTEVRKLYTERTSELELAENRHRTAAELEQLRSATQSSLDLSTVLPPALAEPIKKLAHWLNLRPECYLTALLTGISTLNQTTTRLILNHDWDFEVSPNLFSAIVSPSAQKKSPIIKAMVTKPLRRLQKKARQEYQQATLQYQIDLERYEQLKRNKDKEALAAQFPDGLPRPPRMKLYYFTNATGEGIINQVAAHPNQGILYLKDELAGVFKSANQYRNGRGSDSEDLLSYYDGTGGTVLRADGTQADLDGLLLGVLGSIQPGVLQKFLGDCSDSNGNWARFIFVSQPLAASQMTDYGGKFDLSELMAWLYEELDRTAPLAPSEYRLTDDAFKLFCEAYNDLEKRRVDVTTTPAMQNVWGKSEGRIGKLAIDLHRLKAAMARKIPSPIIDRDTIQGAIAGTYFYAQQVQALYTTLGDEQALSPMLAKVIEIAERKGDWIKASDVYLNITKSKRPNGKTVRQWFRELVMLNKGEVRGQGRSLEFRFNPKLDNLDTSLDKLSNGKSPQSRGVQAKLDKLDNLDDSPEKLISSEEDYGHLEVDKTDQMANSSACEKNPIFEKTSNLSNNNQDAFSERDTALDSESNLLSNFGKSSKSAPTEPTPQPQIKVGSKVKIHWAGSIRDGEIAKVKSIDPEKKMATVWFHNESIRRDLRLAEIPIRKESEMEFYLKLIE